MKEGNKVKIIQTNKIYKCPNCKNTYLEEITVIRFNGYCNQTIQLFKCNKCFGEFDIK